MYHFLDWFFIGFHTALTLFNALGWIFYKTRKWNLVTLLLTTFSWFILGIWHGWGYCVFTDWHWQVRKAMGYTDMPDSYIQFLLSELFGIHASIGPVNTGTAIAFFLSLTASILLNVRDYRRKKRGSTL